ncbi:putative oxidoreductase [Phaeomoniella chlamydospora]|uniref:D-lactate dehydrogenase (cytochrome) n=1 Tax=Phaeomoniella chlamydospora TaxID=158046 RepID=A0A0G2GB73_PHACM|nr:putative oxidoreductase [Phaeomoniella chlamydospora]
MEKGSCSALCDAIKELQGLLGEDAISTDDEDLREHGYSEWSTVNIDALPIAVAYPRNTEEVSQIAKVCTKYRVPMVPFSGGSSLEANFAAPFGGICIDFAFMDHIIAVHDKDMDVVLQPAVQWMELNEKIKHTGLFFPVDPGPSAKIGGMVGTSCSGTNAFRYGTMRDWVVNLTVVLSDGRIIKTRRRPRKTAAGYNLTGLFIGAEGTLGIVTEITLKLAVIPQETRVGVATFPTIRDAASTAMQIIRAGVPVAAMELLDEVQMNVINRAGAVSRRYAEVPTLFFKFSGTTAGVQDNIRISRKIATANNAEDLIFAKNEEEGKALWTARKEALWSMMSLREPGSEVWSTDVAVPISRLPEIIEISKKEMDELGLFASILGHIGDGNFHESIMYQPHEKAAVEHVVHRMVNRALEMEGTVTGEHGIGLGKKQGLVKELGPETIAVMQTIKKSLDPYWLLNPGKIFDYGDVTLTKDISEATAASTLDHPQR